MRDFANLYIQRCRLVNQDFTYPSKCYLLRILYTITWILIIPQPICTMHKVLSVYEPEVPAITGVNKSTTESLEPGELPDDQLVSKSDDVNSVRQGLMTSHPHDMMKGRFYQPMKDLNGRAIFDWGFFWQLRSLINGLF